MALGEHYGDVVITPKSLRDLPNGDLKQQSVAGKCRALVTALEDYVLGDASTASDLNYIRELCTYLMSNSDYLGAEIKKDLTLLDKDIKSLEAAELRKSTDTKATVARIIAGLGTAIKNFSKDLGKTL